MLMPSCDLNTEDLSTIIATGLLFSHVSIQATRRNANHFTE